MAVDLYSLISNNPSVPQFDQAQIKTLIDHERQSQALERSIGQFELGTRTLPDINAEQAARGAFFSTATTQRGGRARENELIARNRGQLDANRRILDLITASGLLPFGRTLA